MAYLISNNHAKSQIVLYGGFKSAGPMVFEINFKMVEINFKKNSQAATVRDI
jgi:hypothetical protein